MHDEDMIVCLSKDSVGVTRNTVVYIVSVKYEIVATVSWWKRD